MAELPDDSYVADYLVCVGLQPEVCDVAMQRMNNTAVEARLQLFDHNRSLANESSTLFYVTLLATDESHLSNASKALVLIDHTVPKIGRLTVEGTGVTRMVERNASENNSLMMSNYLAK